MKNVKIIKLLKTKNIITNSNIQINNNNNNNNNKSLVLDNNITNNKLDCPYKINFISFGNKIYYKSLNRIENEVAKFNLFNDIIIVRDQNLKNDDLYKEFWLKHKNFIESNRRGYGYWIWKSYIILKQLEKMNNNDVLIYADAGCQMNINGIDRLLNYIDIVQKSDYGILTFQMCHLEKTWTKMDTIKFILNDDNKFTEIINTGQIIATTMIIKKCEHAIKLINEWYNTLNNYHLLDDSKSTQSNDNTFREHRHDQSIFSLLIKKYGGEIIPDETWYTNWNDGNKIPILAKRYK